MNNLKFDMEILVSVISALGVTQIVIVYLLVMYYIWLLLVYFSNRDPIVLNVFLETDVLLMSHDMKMFQQAFHICEHGLGYLRQCIRRISHLNVLNIYAIIWYTCSFMYLAIYA